MIHDLFTWLLATFVIGPLQAEVGDKLQAARAPAAIVQQVQSCVVSGAPALVERAMSDPFWGITTTISVVAGLTEAQSVLATASTECAAAISAIKPFMGGEEI